MKKQFIAGILAFATTISLAQSIEIAALVTHLKGVKTELEQELVNVKNVAKEFNQEHIQTLMQFWTEVFNLDFFKKCTAAEIDCYFDIICNQKKTIDELAHMSDEITQLMFAYRNQIIGSQEIVMDPQEYMKPLVKKYFEQDPTIQGDIDVLFQLQETTDVASILNQIYVGIGLLNKINSKIQELEA